MIYRLGVFVRTINGEGGEPIRSLFDYNFDSSFDIDEARNASDYEAKAQAARCLSVASIPVLTDVFRSLIAFENRWETTFDSSYLSPRWEYDQEKKKLRQENWRKAWEKVAGNGLLCHQQRHETEVAKKKGHIVRPINSDNWMMAAERLECMPTPSTVLNEYEREGRELLPPTPSAQKAVATVWGWFSAINRTNGKTMPAVACFRDTCNGEQRTLGFYSPKNETIYMEEFHCSGDEPSKDALQTTVEELVHYLTGSNDCSRDFQEFLTKALVDVCLKG
jgi:hypothetical protein